MSLPTQVAQLFETFNPAVEAIRVAYMKANPKGGSVTWGRPAFQQASDAVLGGAQDIRFGDPLDQVKERVRRSLSSIAAELNITI